MLSLATPPSVSASHSHFYKKNFGIFPNFLLKEVLPLHYKNGFRISPNKIS